MKDEIKEILDRLDFNEWEVDLYKVPITWSELYTIRDYITNLQEENERLKIEKQEEYNRFNLMAKFRDRALERTLIYKSRCENAQDLILNELSHLKANDEETWNKEFYDENNKLDYRKLCIELLNQVINLLDGGDEE